MTASNNSVSCVRLPSLQNTLSRRPAVPKSQFLFIGLAFQFKGASFQSWLGQRWDGSSVQRDGTSVPLVSSGTAQASRGTALPKMAWPDLKQENSQ
jgi:hypothetical protein